MKTYDDPLLQDIATNLASSDPGIRRVAVLELVDSGEPEAAELLILALNDPDPSVRQEAAKVVDEFDAADIADALIAALQDSDEVVRNAAAHALADLKDPAPDSARVKKPCTCSGIIRPAGVSVTASPFMLSPRPAKSTGYPRTWAGFNRQTALPARPWQALAPAAAQAPDAARPALPACAPGGCAESDLAATGMAR